MLFHSNNGYANAPQYNVIPALSSYSVLDVRFVTTNLPIPVAERCKNVCGGPLAEIASSNPAGGMSIVSVVK